MTSKCLFYLFISETNFSFVPYPNLIIVYDRKTKKQRSKILGTSAFYSVFNPNVQPIFHFYMLLDPEPKLIFFLASSKLLNIFLFALSVG